MFYQACRVSGKNSTPCVEKKVEGTVVIEIEALPERDMVVTLVFKFYLILIYFNFFYAQNKFVY